MSHGPDAGVQHDRTKERLMVLTDDSQRYIVPCRVLLNGGYLEASSGQGAWNEYLRVKRTRKGHDPTEQVGLMNCTAVEDKSSRIKEIT